MRMFNTLSVVFSVSLLLICLFEVRAKPTSGQRRLDSHNKCQLFCKHRSCWLITSDTVYVTLASSSHPSTSIAASSRMVFFLFVCNFSLPTNSVKNVRVSSAATTNNIRAYFLYLLLLVITTRIESLTSTACKVSGRTNVCSDA